MSPEPVSASSGPSSKRVYGSILGWAIPLRALPLFSAFKESLISGLQNWSTAASVESDALIFSSSYIPHSFRPDAVIHPYDLASQMTDARSSARLPYRIRRTATSAATWLLYACCADCIVDIQTALLLCGDVAGHEPLSSTYMKPTWRIINNWHKDASQLINLICFVSPSSTRSS